MKRFYEPKCRVLLDNKELLTQNWSVEVGVAGAIGKARLTTSRDMLKKAELSLNDLAEKDEAVELNIYATGFSGKEQKVFGGLYDRGKTKFGQNRVEIHAQDWASILVDSYQTFSEIDYQNQTPSQIVKQIATLYGFESKVDPTPGGTKAGVIFRQDASFTPKPNQPWRILQYLAKQIGFEIFITPHQEIVFKAPDLNAEKMELTWLADVLDKEAIPIFELRTEDSPRRHKTFRVVVQSYHPSPPQMTTGMAIVVGTEQIKQSGPTKVVGNTIISSISSNSIHPGIYVGPAGAAVGSQLKDQLAKSPVYIFSQKGLKPDQAQQKAAAYAKEIVRRQFIAELEIDGYPEIVPQSPIVLREGEKGALDGYAGRNLAATSITHNYSMPSQSGGGSFKTNLVALAVPAGTTSEVAQALSNWN